MVSAGIQDVVWYINKLFLISFSHGGECARQKRSGQLINTGSGSTTKWTLPHTPPLLAAVYMVSSIDMLYF